MLLFLEAVFNILLRTGPTQFDLKVILKRNFEPWSLKGLEIFKNLIVTELHCLMIDH